MGLGLGAEDAAAWGTFSAGNGANRAHWGNSGGVGGGGMGRSVGTDGERVGRLGLDVGWQFEGGHIPIGPPRPRFLLLCVCVGAARLGRQILKKSESLFPLLSATTICYKSADDEQYQYFGSVSV